jgi:hypothetical protein
MSHKIFILFMRQKATHLRVGRAGGVAQRLNCASVKKKFVKVLQAEK